MNLFLRSLFWTILCPGTVSIALPWSLWIDDPTRWQFDISGIAGLVLFLSGAAILLWCVFAFARFGKGTLSPADPTRHLVVRGLYRYVRNPMYLGVLLVLLGQLISFPSWAMLIYWVVVCAAFNTFVFFVEEPRLKRTFGDAYEHYCKHVRRWIPGRPYRTPEVDHGAG